MFNSWRQRWAARRKSRETKQTALRTRRQARLFRHLELEVLETRIVPVVGASQSGGLLTVTLNAANDIAALSGTGSPGVVSVAGFGSFSGVTDIAVAGSTLTFGTVPQTVTFSGSMSVTGATAVSQVSVINVSAGAALSSLGGVSLYAQDMPEDGTITVAGNISTGGSGLGVVADASITVDTTSGPVILSTRQLAPAGNPAIDPSIGNSGPVQFFSRTITVGSPGGFAAQLYSQGSGSYQAGAIGLTAAQTATVVTFVPALALQLNSTVGITLNNATVNGGDISFMADALHARVFYNDPSLTSPVDKVVNTGIQFLLTFELVGGVAISSADAEINLTSASSVSAHNFIAQSYAQADAEAEPKAVDIGAVAVAIDTSKAKVTAAGTITTSGYAFLGSQTDNSLEAVAEAKGNNLGPTPAVAVAVENEESTVQVTSTGVLDVAGDLTVQAITDNHKYVLAQSITGEDGKLGIALAVSYTNDNTNALLDGQVTVGGNLDVSAAETKDNVVKNKLGIPTNFAGVEASSSASQESTGDAISDLQEAFVTTLTTQVKSLLGLKATSAQTAAPSTTNQVNTFSIGAAVAIDDEENNTTARIGDETAMPAVVEVQGTASVDANVNDRPNVIADSSSQGSAGNQAAPTGTQFAGSVAVAVGLYTNNATSFIGSNSSVDAGQSLAVTSEALNDYQLQYGQNLITPSPATFTASGTPNIVTVANGNTVQVDPGHTAGGTVGNWYRYLPLLPLTMDLSTVDFTNTARWKDLGPGIFVQENASNPNFFTYFDSSFGLDGNLADTWSQANVTAPSPDFTTGDADASAKILQQGNIVEVSQDSAVGRPANGKVGDWYQYLPDGPDTVDLTTTDFANAATWSDLGSGKAIMSSAPRSAIAGSITYLTLNTGGNAYIDPNALINQNTIAVPRTGQQTVAVLATGTSSSLNLGGSVQTPGIQGQGNSLKTYNVDPQKPGAGLQGGNLAIGAAFVFVLYSNNVAATVHDGVQMYADSLDVHAQTNVFNISFGLSGATSDNFGFNGVFCVAIVNNTTFGQVDNGARVTVGSAPVVEDDPPWYKYFGTGIPSVTGWGVQQTALPGVDNGTTDTLDDSAAIQAHDYTGLWNVAGGWLASKNSGIGASVAVDEITRDTEALVGDLDNTSSSQPLGGAQTLTSQGNVAVDAKNAGYVVSVALAGTGQSNKASDTSQKQSAADGAGDYGIGVSGDAVFNQLNETTLAYIHDATVSTTGGSDVDVIALNQTKVIAVSGAAAILTSSTSSGSLGLAGSWTQNDLGGSTQAFIDNSTLTLDPADLTVSATTTERIVSISASGSVATNRSGIALAGQVSVNNVDTSTQAEIDNGSSVSANNVTVTATDTDSILAIAGAITYGTKAGFGASVSLNNIPDSGTPNLAYVSLQNSTVTAEGAIQITATAEETILAITAALAAAQSGMAGAISVSLNGIGPATIAALVMATSLIAPGAVLVSASDDATIKALAGGLAGTGGKAAFGAAVAINTIKETLKANLNGSTVTSSGSVTVSAGSSSFIETLTVGGAGADTFSLGGSVCLNTIANTATASIAGGSLVQGRAVIVTFTDNPTIEALAGGIAGSGTASIGAGVGTNNITNVDSAFVDASTIFAVSGVSVTATSTSSLETITIGGAGAGPFALGGAVSLNKIRNTLKARITSGTMVTADGLTVLAADNSTIKALAGGLAGASTVAIGAAVATNDIGNTITAVIDHSTATTFSRGVTVSAASTSSLETFTVGGAGAGAFALGGSVSLDKIRNVLNADITNLASVSGAGAISVTVTDTPSILSLAGGVSGAGAAAIGAALATNDIGDAVFAFIDNSTVTSTNSSVTVSAVSRSSLETFSVGGSGAASFALGGSVSLNEISSAIEAEIFGGSAVSAASALTVSATDTSTIQALAGGVAGAAGAAIGAALGTNDIADTVAAYINGSTATSSSASITISAVSTSSLKSLTVGGAGAAGFALGGSVSLNSTANLIEAYISGAANVTAWNAISVTAANSTTVQALAGGVAGAAAAAIGAALGTNNLGDDVNAFVNASTIFTPLGALAVAATSISSLKSFAVGGSGAAGFALGGSVSLNQTAETVNANIANAANVTVGGGVTVTAADNPTIQAFAGGVAGAAGAAFGASLGTNKIADGVAAYVDNSTINASNGLAVSAASTSSLSTLVAGASGAAGFALGGSVSLNDLANAIAAHVSNNAQVNSTGAITVSASDTPTLSGLAGGAAGAFAAAIGAAFTTNNDKDSITAYIDPSSVQSSSNVTVSATSTPSLTGKVLGAGGALYFGGAGSLAYMTLATSVDAHISGGSPVTASGSISVLAQSTENVTNQALAASGAIVALGAGLSQVTLTTSTNAYVSDAAVVTGVQGITVTSRSDLQSSNVTAIAGGLGIVVLDAALATLNSANNASAYVASGAVLHSSGNINVLAESSSPLNTNAFGGQIGVVCGGASVSTATESGVTTAYVNGATIDPVNLTVSANAIVTINAVSKAGNAGVIAGTWNQATANANPIVVAYISGTTIAVSGNVTLSADAKTSATSNVFSLSIGVLAAGLSVSNATDQPQVLVFIASGSNVSAGGSITLESSHNSGGGTGANATAEAPAVAILGYGGADPTATSNVTLGNGVLPGATLQAGGNIALLSTSTNVADAEAHSVFVGVLGVGTSTPTANIGGTTGVQMGGAITGGQSLTISALVTSNGTSNGGSVSAGVIAGLGVVSNTNVSPTVQASIGNGGAVLVNGAVNITSQSIDNSSATGKGWPAAVIAIGIVNAASTLKPVVDAFIGPYANVTSSGGSIQVQALHNYNVGSTTPIPGKGAHVLTMASGGGVVSVDNTKSTATADATVNSYSDTSSMLRAGANLGLQAFSDNSADGTATNASGALVVFGGVHSIVSANGTTKAFLNGITRAIVGGNLSVIAKGTDTTTSNALANVGGIVDVPSASASADDVPQVQAIISSYLPIQVGQTATIQAVTLGNATANGTGAGGGLVNVGTSNAGASWQPTVTARVGPATSLTTGGDLNIEAYDNYDLNGAVNTSNAARATAIATGGGAFSIDGAVTNVTTNSHVVANIGAGSNLAAGNNLNVLAQTQNNLIGSGNGKTGGLISKGSVKVFGSMTSVTLAQADPSTGFPTRISAGSTIPTAPWLIINPVNTITFQATANNQGTVTASGGSGGLLGQGGGQSSVVLSNPLTEALIGDSVIVNAPNALLQVNALATPNLRATTTFTAFGVITDNEASATAQDIGSQTLANLGRYVSVTVAKLSMLAEDMCAYVSARATADVPFSVAGANRANSTADLISNAQVTIGGGTAIVASNSVTILAWANGGVTDSYAKTSTTGVTGTLYSTAESTQTITANIITASGSTIATHSAPSIQAWGPQINNTCPWAYNKTAITNAQTVTHYVQQFVGFLIKIVYDILCFGGLLWGHKVQEAVYKLVAVIENAGTHSSTPGTDSGNGSNINCNSSFTTLPTCAPGMVIDHNGKVLQLSMLMASTAHGVPIHVGDTVDSTIVVAPIVNPEPGSIILDAPGGSISGTSVIEYNPFLPGVSIINDSPNDLVILGIDMVNQANPPIIEQEGEQTNWNPVLDPIGSMVSPTITISETNPQGGSVILAGPIFNPTGPTVIQCSAGSIEPSGSGSVINSPQVSLSAGGQIGSAGSPLSLQIGGSVSSSPSLVAGIMQANGNQGIYLDVTEIGMNMGSAMPLSPLSLSNINAPNGAVNLTILDAQNQEMTDGGVPTSAVSASSTMDLSNITALGNITITAGSTSAAGSIGGVTTGIMLEGGLISWDGAVSIDASGDITSCDPGGTDIWANATDLAAAGGIGTRPCPFSSRSARFRPARRAAVSGSATAAPWWSADSVPPGRWG